MALPTANRLRLYVRPLRPLGMWLPSEAELITSQEVSGMTSPTSRLLLPHYKVRARGYRKAESAVARTRHAAGCALDRFQARLLRASSDAYSLTFMEMTPGRQAIIDAALAEALLAHPSSADTA